MNAIRRLWPALLSVCAFAQQGTITVYHTVTSVERGTTRQFTAYVPLSPNTVAWSVNGVTGGNSTYGTVTQTGLYSAPAVIPMANVVSVTATSTAYPTIKGSATVTISQPQPWIWSVSPSSPGSGAPVTITLNGAAYMDGSVVTVNGAAWPTTLVSATRVRATGTFPAAGTYAVRVVQPQPGSLTSDPFSITVTGTAPPPISVTVSPSTASVALGAAQQFTANVSATWTASAGTISSSGFYTAPASMPTSSTVTVRATSTADPTKSAQATVTLTATPPPVSVTVSPTTASVALGATQQFTANVSSTWSATAGTITANGLYTAPASMPASSTVTVRATSTADPTKSAQATVTLTLPTSPVNLSAARLLEQAAFGPTPAALADVNAKGLTAWLDEQLTLPETAVNLPSSMGIARAEHLNRMAAAPDQLRQRVIGALSQIIVISANKNIYPDEYIPYVRSLSKHAFGNYRTLLEEITVSPQMGKYLDLANSNKPGLGSGANENFARELIQLFTLGLVQLNMDGSPKLDGAGQPLPTYTQNDVRQFALALTGWTYPTAAGAQPQANNWENFSQPSMEERQANHDTTAKTLLNGVTLPANQTVLQDTRGALDCVFNHPNLPPFISIRLIRALVMSNPSPAYVQRIASVFANNGAGVRGDLKAVVRAILLDPEARQDAATATAGRLKDPLYLYVSFVRNMGGTISAANQIAWIFDRMGQSIQAPPSVFGYYSPLYRLPGNPALAGPEFQIYTPTESIVLGNELWQIISNPTGDPLIDTAPFEAAAAQGTAQLLDLVNARFFYGRMPAGLRTALTNAITPGYDAKQRAQTAIYLSALSGLYAVQY